MSEDSIEPPPFFCPIELVQHSMVDEMEAGFITWMDRLCLAPSHALRQELIDIKASVFAAAMTPWAPAERQQWLTNWLYWFWVPDRYSDVGDLSSRAAEFARLCFALDCAIDNPGKATYADPKQSAAAEASDAFRRLGTASQFRRWRDAQRAFLFGLIHQVANAEQDRIPEIEEYISQRQLAGATMATMPMLEIANIDEVPPAVLASPLVRAITEMSSILVGLDNDLYSYPMEQREDNKQNIVNVLSHHLRLSKTASVSEAVVIRDRIMLQFLRLTESVLGSADQPLTLYANALRNFTRANLRLGDNPRYHKDEFNIPEKLTITDSTSTSDEPLPYPSISWWWTI